MSLELTILINECKKNVRQAQFELYNREYSRLMNIGMRYFNNKEDSAMLVNDAFFKILTNIHKYKEDVPFEAWSARIMINAVIDHFRQKKKIEIQDMEENDLQNLSSGFNEIDENVEGKELEDMLLRLPDDHRLVFNLYEIDGYSHKEIGEQLNVNERTSKRHLAAARNGLKMMYKKMYSLASAILF